MKIYTFLVYKALFILGVLLFAYGFFPITKYDPRLSSRNDIPYTLNGIKFNATQSTSTKLIMIIIDALRYDFVDERMSFINKELNNGEICKIKLEAEAPTVTMPKLKSILTGRTSSFLDVIYNLGDQKLLSDSIIYQLFSAKKKIVFYGDNTWGTLFPKKFFHRRELNYDSFFVNDFYEGDKNITKNINLELEKYDWDILIVHYLGLDHIGHVEGATSPKISLKLQEMDNVIYHVIKKIKERKNEEILLMVTSDHGMRNEGGHGGGSVEEKEIPLLFYGEKCSSNIYDKFNQIDMAATLSAILNLPIPTNNIGKILDNLILGLTMNNQLHALYYNIINIMPKAIKIMTKDLITSTEILFGTAKNYHEEFLKSHNNKNLFEKAKMKYITIAKDLSGYLENTVNYFYMDCIIVGILMSTLCTINIILCGGNSFDFAYGLKDSKLRVLLYFTLCIGFWIAQNILIDIENNFLWFTVPINTFLILNAIWTILKMNLKHVMKSFKFLNKYAIFIIIFSILSLMSSSFIEREHFTWYYCISTLLLLMAFREYQLVVNSLINENANFFVWSKILLNNSKKWIPLLIAHVFMSKINGSVKLTDFTNIAEYLMYGETKLLKLLYLALALFFVLIAILQYNPKALKLLIVLALFTIFCCRFFQENFINEIAKFGHHWSLIFFYFGLLLIIIYGHLFSSGSKPLATFITVFVLLLCVAHRLPNIVLLSGCIFTINFGFKALTRIHKHASSMQLLISESLLSYAVAKMFYFYQGNSNYLGTIDIDTGYLGFDSHPLLVGIIVFIRTYSSQILCFILLLNECFTNHNKKDIFYLVYIISVYIVIRVNVYLFTMLILKNHLFIWSVFSPKFLYEVSELFLYGLLFIFFFSYINLNQYLNLVNKYHV